MKGGTTSLSNHLLIAMPQLTDPNFSQTVSLICEHGEKGALGIVLNRSSETLVEEALPELAPLADEMGAVYVGGPVQPSGRDAGAFEGAAGDVGARRARVLAAVH